MKLGFGLPVAGAWATPAHVAMIARRAEELGYASLWTFQRLLYAVDPRDDYPAMPHALPPRAPSSACSTRPSRSQPSRPRPVRLGLGVLNLPFYTPVLLAEQLATLDYLSRGRLDVGVGLGWARDEYAAVGVPFERRGSKSPSRKPRPPILVGGYAEAPLRRAVTLGDGYISGNAELSKIEPLIGGIRRLHRHRGRGGEGGAYVLS